MIPDGVWNLLPLPYLTCGGVTQFSISFSSHDNPVPSHERCQTGHHPIIALILTARQLDQKQ